MGYRLRISCWLLFYSLLIGAPSHCQETTGRKNSFPFTQLYTTAGFGPELSGQYGYSVTLGIGFTFPNHWGGTVNYHLAGYTSSQLPTDYPSWVLFGLPGELPEDRLKYWSFCIARELYVDKSGIVRLGFEAGPSLVVYDGSSFSLDTTTRSSSGFGPCLFCGPDYIQSIHTETGVGLAMKMRVQFVGRYLGFEFALNSNINKYHSTVGVGFNLLTGYLRNKKPASATN